MAGIAVVAAEGAVEGAELIAPVAERAGAAAASDVTAAAEKAAPEVENWFDRLLNKIFGHASKGSKTALDVSQNVALASQNFRNTTANAKSAASPPPAEAAGGAAGGGGAPGAATVGALAALAVVLLGLLVYLVATRRGERRRAALLGARQGHQESGGRRY